MKHTHLIILLAVCLTACCLSEDTTINQTENSKVIFKNDSTTLIESRAQLIAAIEISVKNLDSLTDKQRNAIAILLMASSEFEGLSNRDPIDLTYKKQLTSFINKVHPEIKIISTSNITGPCSQARFNCGCGRKCNDSINFAHDNSAYRQSSQLAINCAARKAQSRVSTALILLQGGSPILNIE